MLTRNITGMVNFSVHGIMQSNVTDLINCGDCVVVLTNYLQLTMAMVRSPVFNWIITSSF